ncbi:hypothetical protein [Fluviispira sanaruensis]|uniref:Uncharacterized protein n=1 Tax=Fluviispira sanaruensis TaxID=2493639 RepID=A0A4P2VLK3_FLUSA|nr:hypothetical protein [Fluviispira sanaruensis]BBH52670.1 hypothetical protein JCM31447_11110 [Fluviispira sanaruensis]
MKKIPKDQKEKLPAKLKTVKKEKEKLDVFTEPKAVELLDIPNHIADDIKIIFNLAAIDLTSIKDLFADMEDKFKSAINDSLITHNAKIPATHCSKSAFVPKIVGSLAEEKYPYVCSRTIHPARSPYYNLNVSAYSKQIKLLVRPYKFEGENFCLLDSLIYPEHKYSVYFKQAFELYFPPESYEKYTEIVHNRINSGVPNSHGDMLLRFPTGDGQYVALSPVASLPVSHAIKDRIRKSYLNPLLSKQKYLKSGKVEAEKYEEKTFFRMQRVFKVGGSNPQNAGDFVSASAGRVPLIYSPLFSRQSSDIWRKKSFLLDFSFSEIAKSSWKELDVLTSSGGHWIKYGKTILEELNLLLENAVSDAIFSVRELEVKERKLFLENKFKKIHNLEINFLAEKNLSEEEIRDLAKYLSMNSIEKLQKYFKNNELDEYMNKMDKNFLKSVLKEMWENNLKG